MKYADFSGLAVNEIQKKIGQLRGEIFEVRMKNSLGQLSNPMEIRSKRRDIARLKTAASSKTGNKPLSKASRADRREAATKANLKSAAKSKAVKG